jgi:hypothetical protein
VSRQFVKKTYAEEHLLKLRNCLELKLGGLILTEHREAGIAKQLE